MAKLKLLSTIFSKLGSLTKNNGQIIVTRDSKSLYVDLEGERIEITDWIDVDTEETLLSILTPLTNKYYYTKDSNKIWRYINNDWECLNTSVNDLTPTYTESSNLVKLSSGEKLSVAFGKISKAITDLISHIGDSVKHITSTERTNWNVAKTHADSAHAPADATKVEKSSTNGNIKINGTETTVYTHPSGTNPHGTTKSDVGLGNVGNFKAVSTVANQGLSDTEKANARANIGAGTSSFSGSYNDLTNKPTIPINNNQLTNGAGYITSSGTAKTISDTLPISKGGTGKTTGVDAANTLINSLSTGESTPTDADYYISQYVGGGTSTTTYHRRPMSALWNYIKSKLATVATSGSYNDLSNKPTIPSVGNGTVTIKQAGTSKGTFTMNQTGNTTIELTDNNTTYSNFVKSGSGAKSGLVPAPSKTAGTTKYLREDGTWTVPPDTNTTYSVATTSANGLMSSSDKSKLDGIASGAEVNQNAYSKISVVGDGAIVLSADEKESSVEFDSGTGINIGFGSNSHSIMFTNTGVTNVNEGAKNGTINVTLNGKTAVVPVKGLGSAAYTNSGDYLSKSGGTVKGTLTIDKSGTSSNTPILSLGNSSNKVMTYIYLKSDHPQVAGGWEAAYLYEGGKSLADKYQTKVHEVVSSSEPSSQVSGDYWLEDY